MKHWRILFLFLVFALGGQIVAQSSICSYSFRKRISINPSQVAGTSDITNFPVMIKFSSDNDLRTVANSGYVENSNGYDIVFTAEDGVTLLDFELERYNASTGELTAWVKVPVLYTNISTNIYMYYGNTAISTNQSSAAVVWSDYYAVWHLENNSFADASGNGQTASNFSTTNQSPAYINDGRLNNGTQWMEMASFPNLTTNFSMSAWGYTNDNTRGGQRIFCDDEGVSGAAGYALSIADGGTGRLRFFSRGSNPVILDSPSGAIASNTWYHMVGVANISALTKSIYINGSNVASGSYTGAWGTDNGKASIAGEVAGAETGNRLLGRIDEVRIAKTALSADWIATEYNNQSSPSTFYSVSTQPNVFVGSSNTNWTTNANWSSGTAPTASVDIILSAGSNQPNLNTDFQSASVWIRPNTTLTIGNGRTLSVLRDVTNCGVIQGGNNSSELLMNGSNASTPNQYLSGSGEYTLRDLTINSTHSLSPTVNLSTSVTVSSDLVLTSGVVATSSSNILALGTGASSSSGSSSSYVSGPMTKAGTAAFVFPVGKGGSWRRIGISAPSSSSTFRAEYFNSAFTSTSPVTSPINNVSSVEFWQLDRLAGTGSASVTLYWQSASSSGITNCPDLTIARWNNTSWVEVAATATTGSSCSGTGAGAVITNAVNGSFSPFTFGSKLGSVNPLPVELLDFSVSCDGPLSIFNWKTASEKNAQEFRVEFSYEGKDWSTVGIKPANGTSSSQHSYQLALFNITNGYYRLVQKDFDGTETVFTTVINNCEFLTADQVTIIPNPTEDSFTVDLLLASAYGYVTVSLFDLTGRQVASKTYYSEGGRNVLQFEQNLQPGVYIMRVESPEKVISLQKLIAK